MAAPALLILSLSPVNTATSSLGSCILGARCHPDAPYHSTNLHREIQGSVLFFAHLSFSLRPHYSSSTNSNSQNFASSFSSSPLLATLIVSQSFTFYFQDPLVRRDGGRGKNSFVFKNKSFLCFSLADCVVPASHTRCPLWVPGLAPQLEGTACCCLSAGALHPSSTFTSCGLHPSPQTMLPDGRGSTLASLYPWGRKFLGTICKEVQPKA